MSAESPRHARSGGPLTIPSQPPSDRSIIDTVSGFISDVTLSSTSTVDPKDVIQWARFETADINEPTPEGDSDNDISPLLLILGYGAGVQVWLIPPSGEAQEVLSWRQGTVRVLRILPTPQHGDCFASKRPLIALCDSASPGPSFCSLSFISIRGGEQVKSIKFKNPILDVLANKRSVVVSFSERFAVFDAATLEDRLTVTTCYPCPCPLGGSSTVNPLALGDRWLAYADKKLNPSKRSSGGCEGEGVTSYTATVLHAAKSLSKGLRGLGESVAQSLSGGRSTSQSPSPPNTDAQQPGVVTILDIENNEEEDGQDIEEQYDPIVAHFIAHSEAVIALKFDSSGMLLVTADRRGHDFHVFRVNPHPCGPSLASVHHLYILHRGDTTAKVQDIAISGDSRWAAVSTLRGTTHVFAISPYGGACGVRTHTQPRVVNRLSRFHRSAGLPIHTSTKHVSGSPVSEGAGHGAWFPNPRLPPYPQPAVGAPLAQLRPTNLPTHTITRTSSGRQRLSSVSEECQAPLLARARFGAAPPARSPAVAPLYLLAPSGCLLQLLLHPKPARGVPKEKVCDESPLELDVEPLAQWPLQRPATAADLLAPLPPASPLLQPLSCRRCADTCMSEEERWLSQVEIVTHAGPHRRLWMGPQFVFKTYNCTGSNSSLSEAECVEVETGVARSNPVNMPGVRPAVPVLIDSGSPSSLEQSPSDSFRRKCLLAEGGRAPSVCDVRLKEDLAEAMKEDHGWLREELRAEDQPMRRSAGIVRAVDPQGTVVAPPAVAASPPADDPDSYTRSNADEATFRPVVRAPAAISIHPEMVVRPLPRNTTIPVQTVSPTSSLSPENEPVPLNTDVVIPAELTAVRDWLPVEIKDEDVSVSTHVDVKECNEQNVMTESGKPNANLTPGIDISVDNKKDVNIDLERRQSDVCERDGLKDSSINVVERKSAHVNESLPKSNKSPDDIQPVARVRVKKSPTPKSVSDTSVDNVSYKRKSKEIKERKIESITETKAIDSKNLGESVAFTESEEIKSNRCSKEQQEIKEVKKAKENKAMKEIQEAEACEIVIEKKDTHTFTSESIKADSIIKSSRDNILPIFLNETNDGTNSFSSKKADNRNSKEKDFTVDSFIKTEEQAWDMLLNDPEKCMVSHVEKQLSVDNIEEPKPKSKKNRKTKKNQEDSYAKEDEDSFVEIHAIEDKQQPSSGELVSISSPFEEMDSCSYMSKSKNSRPSKPYASERCDEHITIDTDWKTREQTETRKNIKSSWKSNDLITTEIKSESSPNLKLKDLSKKRINLDPPVDCISSKTTPCVVSDIPKYGKTKSLSPCPQGGCYTDSDAKDVYVINTTEEDFPEIQITRANKIRKKSPQPSEQKIRENVVDKPVKSWSSIAASKHSKIEPSVLDNKGDSKEIDRGQSSSIGVSFQEKLFELCKRTDILVAECDAPSELNFVEEHHAVIQELPPLEPLEFALDDFKLEVMRDSLLEVNEAKVTSPICKINIDDILSSIKETSSRVIESSSFNLIDLERVPAKKEKGFSVINCHKITSQEVNIEENVKCEDKEREIIEKSSDDDIASPVVSTDSDKDDKKSNGSSNILLMPSKQSVKSKKSRKKKK